ncbi:MAG: septal ring lytic transglycosylase RlpA family protein [Candidatus Omnitrophota bacterium]
MINPFKWYRRYRLRKAVKITIKVLKSLDLLMKRMGYSRQTRREIWRKLAHSREDTIKFLEKTLVSVTIVFFLFWATSVFAKGGDTYKNIKTGIASFYGAGEELNEFTASRERFDPEAMCCATYDFPMGTYLKVTNIGNGKSVVVRVNDLGPAKRLNRLADLTFGAFKKIADPQKGLIAVTVVKLRRVK